MENFLLEYVYGWAGFNESLFHAIYALRSETLDLWLQSVTRLGSYHNFPYYFIAIFGYVALSYIIRLIRGETYNKQFLSLWLGVLSVLLVAQVVNGVSVLTIKNHTELARPYVQFTAVEGLDKKPNLHDELKSRYSSFPSGHTAFTLMMVAGLWPALGMGLRILGVAFVFVMAWSRISLGMHFPADIVASVILTLFVVNIIRSFVYGFYYRLFKIHCI